MEVWKAATRGCTNAGLTANGEAFRNLKGAAGWVIMHGAARNEEAEAAARRVFLNSEAIFVYSLNMPMGLGKGDYREDGTARVEVGRDFEMGRRERFDGESRYLGKAKSPATRGQSQEMD